MDVDDGKLYISQRKQTDMHVRSPHENDKNKIQNSNNNLTMSNMLSSDNAATSTRDDINKRLLNAKLPEGAYDLVRDVPKEFLQASFDPVAFVDQKLKSSAFSPTLLDNMIKDADQMLDSLDQQIAESLEIDPAPVPPSMDSAQELLKNLVVLGKKADESRQKAVQFAQQLQKLQNARKQLDTLALQIALCKLFKDESKTLSLINDLEDIKEHLSLMKSVYLLHLAEHELHGLRDTPQLQDSFSAFDKFTDQISKLKSTCKHTDDSFNFWSQQAIILGYKAAVGELHKYYDELSTNLMKEAFPELFDVKIQQFNYLKRVSAFIDAHKHYMKDLEAPITEAFTEAMHRYTDIQQRYGQITSEQQQIQTGTFYKHFCSTLLENIINQAKSFAQRVIENKSVDSPSTMSQQYNGGQQKLLILQQQLEQLEQQLAQDPDSGVRAGAIAGWCPESTDMILQQISTQLKNIVAQQIKPCYKQVSDTNAAMLQILSIFEQFPHECNAEQGQQLLQQLNEDVQEVLPILLKNLDFSQYVTLKVEKQINGIRAGHNGNFYNIFKGISAPLLKLQSFNCGTLMFIDPSAGDARNICMQTLINLRQLDEVFAKALCILQSRVYFKAEELIDPYAFSEAQQEAQAMVTQALIQVLVGGFHVGVFCGGSRGRSQAIVAAKDALLVQLEQVQESGVIGIVGDFQDMQFCLQLSNTIIEQVGTIFVGNLIKEGFSSNDIQLLYNTISQLHEELDKDHIADEDGLLRLKLAINTKILASEGAVPSRTEFQALASGIDGAQQQYDEICLGIFAH